MRELKLIESWKSVFTCSKCGVETEMYHGNHTREGAWKDIPEISKSMPHSGTWNGWFVGINNKELCPICYGEKMLRTPSKKITVECRK